ncbi:MAG: ABC transporter permease [Nitrospirae bacterium]|nr:ABC transporter permease [Nitrospirota bacterium]
MTAPGFYVIFWREMLAIRKKFWKFLTGSLVMPVLYLVTFGWGVGGNMRMGGGSYLEFVLPGIIALSAMNNSFNGVATTLNISKLYYRTIEEIMVSPVSPWSIALGRVLAGCVRGMFSALLLVALGSILHVEIRFNLMFVAVLFLTTFAFGSLGVLAAMITKSHEDMANFSNVVILPMAFLSGTFFSPTHLPEPFTSIIMAYPLTHASLSLRAIAAGGGAPVTSLLILTFYAALFFTLGGLSVKRLEL